MGTCPSASVIFANQKQKAKLSNKLGMWLILGAAFISEALLTQAKEPNFSPFFSFT